MEQLKFDDSPNSVHVVVDESQVEQRSRSGYVLIYVIYTDVLEMAQDTEERPWFEPGCTYPSRTDTTSRTTHHLARQARFVMRLDADSAIALKEQELMKEEQKRGAAEASLRLAKEQAALLLKEKEVLGSKVDHFQRENNLATAERDRFRDSKRKLEADIGKLREAIGEIRMKEILGV